jgi:hypothetical protein
VSELTCQLEHPCSAYNRHAYAPATAIDLAVTVFRRRFACQCELAVAALLLHGTVAILRCSCSSHHGLKKGYKEVWGWRNNGGVQSFVGELERNTSIDYRGVRCEETGGNSYGGEEEGND